MSARAGLDELRIRGLGVIDDAVLPLGPGLTVVTGETGAGKTMVVTGLLLLFGGRADSARVRTGCDQASVDGRLVVADESPVARRVRAAGGDLDHDSGEPGGAGGAGGASGASGTGGTSGTSGAGGAAGKGTPSVSELVLRRVVSAGGRSRASVGGAAAPVSVLAELAEHLLAVHGQADQLRLVRPAAQRAALDRYAGIDPRPLADAFGQWRGAQSRLAERVGRAAELRRESDLLVHGIGEIETVAPQPGEVDDLTAVAARLARADALEAAARGAHDALLGDPDDPALDPVDATAQLGSAARALAHEAGADPQLDALAGRLTDVLALAADLGSDFGAYADHLESDPARLEAVESRRAELNALVRKYCDEPEPSLDAVLRWADSARARLAEIDVSDEAVAMLRSARDAAAARLSATATEVSRRRRVAAAQLARAVTEELAGLAMSEAHLDVSVDHRPALPGAPALTVAGTEVGVGPEGIDEVEFRLRSHPGAPSLGLGRGASGGELSRVMLALEVCLTGSDPVPTMVFDEVDAGVGGRAAVEVGRRLARLARDRQVLVVTHLAQVAAFADRHVVVDKPPGTSQGVTASDLRVVSGPDRLIELARMLAGTDSDTAREHAAELLADAARDDPGGRPRAKRKATSARR